MKTLNAGDLINDPSKVLDIVSGGEEVTFRSDKRHRNIAVLIPFDKYRVLNKKRKLGILESKASFTLREDFKITGEELLSF